jgi:hypothetical protein
VRLPRSQRGSQSAFGQTAPSARQTGRGKKPRSAFSRASKK